MKYGQRGVSGELTAAGSVDLPFRRRGWVLLGALLLGTAQLGGPTGACGSSRIGINVLFNRPVSEPILADLAAHGQVLDTFAPIRAVTLAADVSELPRIQALPYVATANPDRPRSAAGAPGGVPVSDFTGGANLWNLDAVNVTDFGTGRTVPYDGEGVYVGVFDSGLVPNWRAYFPEERIDREHARAFGGGGGERGAVSERPELWEHDTHGHGTMVTSVILGTRYSGPEQLPASFNGAAPKVTVIPVKIRGNNHLSRQLWSSVLTHGLLYLTGLKTSGALGAAPLVVNISLEGPDPDAVERAAIDYAIAHGVVIVAAAANQGENGMWYPGAYPPVISAGNAGWVAQFPADDPTGLRWILRDVPEQDVSQYFISPDSSRELPGQDLDVVAPGFAVPVAFTSAGRLDYTFFFGTSAASPHAVGVAALMLQKNPQLTQAQIEAILQDTALPVPAGIAATRFPAIGPGNPPTWGDSDNVTFFDLAPGWGANATGHGLLQADGALAATPSP